MEDTQDALSAVRTHSRKSGREYDVSLERTGTEAKLEWDDGKPQPAAGIPEAAGGSDMPDLFAAPTDEAAGDDEFAWEDV